MYQKDLEILCKKLKIILNGGGVQGRTAVQKSVQKLIYMFCKSEKFRSCRLTFQNLLQKLSKIFVPCASRAQKLSPYNDPNQHA